jgi:hypothetical protein
MGDLLPGPAPGTHAEAGHPGAQASAEELRESGGETPRR